MTLDSAGDPVATGQNPTREVVVNTTAVCSQIPAIHE